MARYESTCKPGLRCALAAKQLVKYTLFYGKDFICEIFSVMTNKHARNDNAFVFNWHGCSLCFCFQTLYPDSSRKWGSCLSHVLSVFNARFSWFEYVLHAVISQIISFRKRKFRNWTRLRDCCRFALWMLHHTELWWLMKTTMKTRLQAF